ncbi:MAG TPA: NAD(P)/FAD-dependent oxidoreductase [Acetobacteraceae bacterium]|nr:NAD(P)/FAD-dependent oxidoreductase [Acetobacteraceae bacterium]
MSNERHELAIIGGGPAGMAAAITAAALGVDTILLDEQRSPGGQIYRNIEQISSAELQILGDEYRRGVELAGEFRASPALYRPQCIVWQTSPDGRIGITGPDGARMLLADRILLATGAMERPVAVPGWTMPGVMGVGAVQALLKASGVVPDFPVVIAGSGPLIYLVAVQLARAGCTVAALLVTTPMSRIADALKELPRMLLAGRDLVKGIGWMNEVRRLSIPTSNGVSGIRIEGAGQADAVSYEINGTRKRISAGLVLLHEGVIPNVQLSLSTRCRHVWDQAQACWRPETDEWGATSEARIAVAGDGAGIHGAAAAEALGRIAALDAAYRFGRIDQSERDRRAVPERAELARHDRLRRLLDRVFQPVPGMLTPGDADTIVCRCEEVTMGMLRDAVRVGGEDPNRAKLLTRCGMGPCQGRMCGPTVAAVIARETGRNMAEVGTYRIRIPVRPVPLAALADLVGEEEGLLPGEATL